MSLLIMVMMIIWLVVDLPLWKMMDLKSVGMLFHSQYDGKVIKTMFQTTNQLYIVTASDKGWPMIVGGYTTLSKKKQRFDWLSRNLNRD